MKAIPVLIDNKGPVGILSLDEAVVKELELKMECKSKDLEAEPFTVAFSFKVDLKETKVKLLEMIITSWSES